MRAQDIFLESISESEENISEECKQLFDELEADEPWKRRPSIKVHHHQMVYNLMVFNFKENCLTVELDFLFRTYICSDSLSPNFEIILVKVDFNRI